MRTLADIKEEDIPSLTAGELKALLQYHQINYTGCFEKGEFVQLALQAKRQLAPPDATPAIVPYFGRQDKKTIDYYAILGVEKTAAISEITRAYYKLARVNHPDKNPNDPFAEERFKLISEAYQILSDPDKRQRYDQFGAEGVSDDFADPTALFRMLFGNGKFDKIFGDLSFCDMDFAAAESSGAFDSNAYEQKQTERQKRLAHQLTIRLEPFVQGAKDMFISMNEQDANELCEVPGGQDLLMMIGYVYIQEAKQHMDTFLGIPAFFARVAEKGHLLKIGLETVAHVVRMQQAQAKLEKDQANGVDTETAGQDAMMQQGLKTIWALGKLEIETTLRTVCEEVLKVSDKKLRHKRAKGLKLVGEIFQKVAKRMHNGDLNLFSAFVPPQSAQPPQPQQQQK